MDRESIVQKFETLNLWKSDGARAPHKPLLVLYTIGELLRGKSRLLPYSEIDENLGNLLSEFGPRQSGHGTQFPFWRLQNDGIWEISDADKIRQTASGDALKGDLVHYDVSGGFTEDVAHQLQNDSDLAFEIVQNMLDAHFPASIHEDILQAVGIELIRKSFDTHHNAKLRGALQVNNGLASGEQRDLIAHLRKRFPLLDRLIGRFGKETPGERIPWFFALLLSAATSHDRGACCFVLDKTLGTTAATAIFLALIKLQEEFPQMARNYAQTALHHGQRVKVKPSNYVYEYEGVWEEHPGRFRLKVMGEQSWRSFWISDVLRLEPTDRVRPKGKVNSKLGTFERSRLDELLDLTTCGNNSLFRNTVLLHMAQAKFSQAADAIALAPKNNKVLESLSEFLPWGSIGPRGELKPNDDYQVTGEPIIGITRVPEDLALASSSAKAGTKVVLVDGARGLARDLQAFDDVADRQRVVILASPEETEALDLLRDHDCPIWHMSPDEILIGESSPAYRDRASLVGATIRAADTRQRAKVVLVDCQDGAIQSVAESLGRAAALVSESEEAIEVDEILACLYGILLECSECCFGAGEDIEVRLQTAQELLTRYGKWLNQEFTSEVDEAICGLVNIIASGSCGQGKADALLRIILDGPHGIWAVVSRSQRTAESLRAGLVKLGVDVPVLPVAAISPVSDYSGVIVPAWPNDQKFTRLKNQAVTPDIRVLAYPFEAKWVSRHQARERARERSNRMEIETRSSILGIESRFLTSKKCHEPDSPVNEVGPDQPIFRFEDRVAQRRIKRPAVAVAGEDSREAQLVQFFGDCYTLLTEWAQLPRLNDLIDNANTVNAGLRHVKVSQLVQGDFVLFRASEDKEFIRQIAEEILGLEEYERVRTVAERWRSSLRHLGASTAEVQRHLEAFGLTRSLVTVAGWLNNQYRIGPGDFGDIEAIARAAGDNELLSNREKVESAITQIRSTHIGAGRQLTQLILGELGGRLNSLDDQPMLLDLDYGAAWVVQVDTVEVKRREYPTNLVNRLLWADDTSSWRR